MSERVFLPGPLPVRLALWLLVFAAFPLSGPSVRLSFHAEVLGRSTTIAALPPEERASLSDNLSERVLARLEASERKETDPWVRDDIRIAWITVLWSARGVPEWSWHRDSPAYVAATYQVLAVHPDQVWDRIVARRKVMLGAEYENFFGGSSSPKKPVRSVFLDEARRRNRTA